MDLRELIKVIENFSDSDIDKLRNFVISHDQIIMIGNGGSNAICSHISQDYTKRLGTRSYGFSDASRLTCYINDYGRDAAYERFLKEFVVPNTGVVLISSSGNSENIFRCASYCTLETIPFIMLTGFSENNRMRSAHRNNAILDLWVDSSDYGVVECAHQIFLHSIVESE